MKVAELTGALLDFEVGLAEGVLGLACTATECFARKDAVSRLERYSPSTDWAHGGPIIEREGIELKKDLRHLNLARIGGFEPDLVMPGRTPLIAAMRCYVASKFGEEVSE